MYSKPDPANNNESVALTDEDLQLIKKVRDSIGDGKEFDAFLMNYDLSDYPILNVFSVEFFNKLLRLKSKQTVIDTQDSVKEYLYKINNLFESCKTGKGFYEIFEINCKFRAQIKDRSQFKFL